MTLSKNGHGPAVLRVTPVADPAGTRVRLAGELDITTGGHLVDVVCSLPAQAGSEVRLDVAELTFIDVVGLTALLRSRAHVLRGGGRLLVLHPSPLLRRMLDITGLGDILLAEPGPAPATSARGIEAPQVG